MPATALPPDEALDKVTAALGDKVSEVRLSHGQIDFVCPREHLQEVMAALRDNADLRCRYFTFLSGVDRSTFTDDAGGLEVLIHVYSPENVIHVTVHVPVEQEAPACPSIAAIYAGAIWHERETWEMFGIDFAGHPNLVNLYLPEDFEGHPLLKTFKLPSRAVKEWPGAKDPDEAAAGR